MESPNTNEYFISRPENFGSFDLCKFFFSRKCLSTYQFVETSTQPGAPQFSLIVILTLFLEKILLFIYKPLKLLGNVIEFVLNFYALNGGVFGLLWRVLTVSVVIPDKNSASYRSVLAFVDSRVDLFNTASSSNKVYKINNTFNAVEPFDLTAMASKIAYENPAFVQNAVEKHWKMHFVKFFSCWNEFYKANTTQAFICSDKAKDAQLIVLAFRGTEPFNSQDWATDVNLSWISTGKMGKVHMGFMKALGLTDEREFAKGFPAESPLKDDPSKALAYYSIRDTLNALLKENPKAKVLITGHSLGGALATLFPALLLYHNQTTILNSLLHVFTFGQPRVGDEDFANFMLSALMLRYRHIVYRYDIVPRVPLDLPPVSLFKHFGDCIYHSSWYAREAVDEEPNKDYFSLKYIPSMHFHALVDLIRGVFAWLNPGVEFEEGLISILFRAVGLLIPGLASHSPRDYVNGGRLSKFHAVDLF